jgi:hypothetical protein
MELSFSRQRRVRWGFRRRKDIPKFDPDRGLDVYAWHMCLAYEWYTVVICFVYGENACMHGLLYSSLPSLLNIVNYETAVWLWWWLENCGC